MPPTLDEKVDVIAEGEGTIIDGDDGKTGNYFVSLGPTAVRVVTAKLNESVAKPVSPEAEKVDHLAGLSDADRKRVEREIGLLRMQALALTRLKLSPEIRKEALESIYKAMQSPYATTRHSALEYIKVDTSKETVEQVLQALRDPDETNRHIATSTLLAVGQPEDADKLERILRERSQKKSPEEMSKDTSIRYGYEIARKLRSKSAERAK